MAESNNSEKVMRGCLLILLGLVIGVLLTFIHVKYFKPRDDHSTLSFTELQGNPNPDKKDNQETFVITNNITVLCLVMTYLPDDAIHVKRTWGKRCTKVLYMSNVEDPKLPTVLLQSMVDGSDSWTITRDALKYVYKNHREEADWVIMGYVLSKEALKRVVQHPVADDKKCKHDPLAAEDFQIRHCLKSVGVEFEDSRDKRARYRFVPYIPSHNEISNPDKSGLWHCRYFSHAHQYGLTCCSDTAFLFSNVSAREMYVKEYMIYHLHLYGIPRMRGIPGHKDVSQF